MSVNTRRRLPLLIVAILLAACNGGTVDRHALENDSKAIDSLACEGALLANQVEHGATTDPFTRVHAGELETRASNFEDALSERPATPGMARAVRREAARAGRIAGLLRGLGTADPVGAIRLESRLQDEGSCA